jgi:hypothetical protein
MSVFTALESAVLEAICEAQPSGGDQLRECLRRAKLTRRENTGHGFYTHFSVGSPTWSPDELRLLDGPIAHMLDMGDGMIMGFILWFEDGAPDCLEGFQYGDALGDTLDLKERDLAKLAFSNLSWS